VRNEWVLYLKKMHGDYLKSEEGMEELKNIP
jgi:hypothetical protein